MSRVAKKADFMTISIYAVLAAFAIYFAAALGACFDLSLDENGKADFDKLANSLEAILMDTDVVLEQLKKGEKALQFPIFAAFGIGLYALMKVTNKKKFHRKGEEHGSARWANQKEIKSLLDKPPKPKKENIFKRIFIKIKGWFNARDKPEITDNSEKNISGKSGKNTKIKMSDIPKLRAAKKEHEYIIDNKEESIKVSVNKEKVTEPAVTSKSVRETKSETSETVTEAPARVIYQTIYNGNSEEKITEEIEKTEVSKSEESEKEETDQQELSESESVTTVPEKYKAEEFQSSSEVHSQAAVTTMPQEKILYFTDNSTAENSEINAAESTETAAVAVTENTAENVSAANNAQAFLLLAGVFGAAVAAAVLIKKFKKKNISEDADLSELSARERDEIRLNKQKRRKPKKQKVRKKRVVPKTMQKTLPYKRVCDNYIFKVEENRYSKTYRFEDINYSIAKQEEQEGIFLGYCSVLNSFDTSADIQVTVHNNRVNKEKFNEMVLLKHKGDDFDKYVDSYNDMLVEKMEQGQNGIIRNKYLTVTVQAAYLEAAKSKFATIDLELTNAFKKIGSAITPMTSNERVELLKDIFRNVDEKFSPLTQSDFNRQAERAYCCPDYFEFKKDYFMWNDKYARTMFIKDMPASLKDCLLTDIANTNLDVMTTVNITPVDPAKALKIVNHQLTSMRANKLQAEKKAIQSGYTSDVINEELKYSLVEAEELLDDLRSKNQKMFMTNIVIMVTANDFDELENNTEAIEAVVRKHICSVSTLKFQQEKGLQSVLPIGNCTLEIRRTLTTESTAVFLPFSSKEISQENGMYYGLNALSNNLIIFNRLMLKNPNGFILGSPGSGKSFSAKREMVNVFLATDDDIIIIDPEREYSPLVKALAGEIINVSPASTNYINPLDMSQNYSDDENPLVMKSDFILSFFECLVGKQGLTAKERGIIDRCLTITYAEYMQDFDAEKIPTLIDFYEVLKSQPEKEAKGLALSFELYIKGNLNVFAHKTNVNTTNRVSRLYSILNDDRHKVGRVKTPVLNIIAKRDEAIAAFMKVPFHKVVLENGAECEKVFETSEQAEAVRAKCEGKPVAVTSAKSERKKENRPLLHSLTSLQRVANDIYGITAADTLKAAQSLYEKKLITYPRTDSNYLSDDMISLVESIVKCLATYDGERVWHLQEQGLLIDSRVIDNDKISDHHAIIPTNLIGRLGSTELSDNEKNVAKLVINRFLCALDKPYLYTETKYEFTCEGEIFKLTVKTPELLGWRRYYASKSEENPVVNYSENDFFTAENISVKQGETQPQKRFTESTLLAVMENIDRLIPDKALSEFVKERGLGTPATRAAIIEELIAAGYVERKKKQLISTEYGRKFAASLPENVKSAELTARWEQALSDIENGIGNADSLLSEIVKSVSDIVDFEKSRGSRTAISRTKTVGTCPRCGKPVVENSKGFSCSAGRGNCGFFIFKSDKRIGRNYTAAEISELLRTGRVTLKNCVSSNGKKYSAVFSMDDTGKYVNLRFERFVGR